MVKVYLNLKKDMSMNKLEAKQTSSKMNLKRSALRHIIKLSKDKENKDKLDHGN